MKSNADTPDTPARHRWLPTIGLSLWLIFVLALTLSPWRLVMINADGDTCLHWRIGHWMIEHRAVLRSDVFSHTRAGAPVVTMEWLSEVVLAAAGDALGWNGIVLLVAVIIATGLWRLHRQLLSEGSDLLLSTGLTLLASFVCYVHWFARPHVISFVFLVILGEQLWAFEQGQVSTRQLWWRLVPLTMVWVNLHAGFLTGLMLIGIGFIGAGTGLWARSDATRLESYRKMWSLALVGIACLIASLANPNGWRLYGYIGGFLRHAKLVSFVNEFRSPNFHSRNMSGFLLMLGGLAITLIVIRARLQPTEVLLIGWAGCCALRWVRNVPIFAIVATPILARHLNAWLQQVPDAWLRRYREVARNLGDLNRRADGRWTVAIAMVLLAVVVAKPRVVGGAPILETAILTNRFPGSAVGFLRQNPRAVSGEMFNDYGWGGYLILVMPEHRVFVDGRNDFYGANLIQDFRSVSEVHTNWEVVLHRCGVGWTILPRAHPLNELLALRSDWSVAYADDVAAIYVRKPE